MSILEIVLCCAEYLERAWLKLLRRREVSKMLIWDKWILYLSTCTIQLLLGWFPQSRHHMLVLYGVLPIISQFPVTAQAFSFVTMASESARLTSACYCPSQECYVPDPRSLTCCTLRSEYVGYF
ncbi:hypothetical protein F5Y17DRAFT_38685 [Xylariaceae sp. FL0594]|nr:hypothetical protein F5Y17DRAFT_38685 [Xylariaceae sp. FL0594]